MSGSPVQSAILNTTGALSLSAAFPVANTAGNAIVVIAGDGAAASATMTITDTLNTYGANLDTTNDASNGCTSITNAASNCAGGSNTVKVTNSASHQMGLAIIEVTGVGTGAVDGHAQQNQLATTAPNSGNATNSATAFGVGFSWITGVTVTVPAAGAGWTSTTSGNITASSTSFANGTPGTGGGRLEWKSGITASATSNAPFTAASSDFLTSIVMLDESGAAPPSPHSLMMLGMGN